MRPALRVILVLALLVATAVSSFAAGEPISGAGSSAAKRVYQSWGVRFAEQHGISLNYGAVGSSEGVRRIIAADAQFSTSDVAPETAVLDTH